MRPKKKGTDRTELALGLPEEAIASDAFARVIDLFVDQLGDLTRLGFGIPAERAKNKGGAPAYSHGVLLKCYRYGYYYGIHSNFSYLRCWARCAASCCQNSAQLAFLQLTLA